MDVKEMAAAVGKDCVVRVWVGSDALFIPARIVDVRASYGRTDYRVSPTGGSGETWVSAERVKVAE